jgi:hypothetical protein
MSIGISVWITQMNSSIGISLTGLVSYSSMNSLSPPVIVAVFGCSEPVGNVMLILTSLTLNEHAGSMLNSLRGNYKYYYSEL